MTSPTATSCCCRKSRASWRSRTLEAIAWIIPSAVLALIPKCPICLAAYLALFTGIGVPLSTAGYLRTGLIASCCISMGYLALRRLPKLAIRWSPYPASRT
ncbi:hypothetical protein M4951_11320 [Blastopirellula sp. J2-11]|uniref:hypothetical protein n=1 Tax=Blastopirellula sp. J2-11 TaxID=2943192 RepID=UPI0021C98509|nr:hypothetical protein [Blastopirellula sp. J2-11]UUO08882.1 hypothetical protein M4951_11320 [Blastopirellula sp. J2-11]